MPSNAQLQTEALRMLETVDKRRSEFTPFEDYFKIRTAEFLLLTARLRQKADFACCRVLEVGCGIGYSLCLWSLLADEVVGLDLPEALVGTRPFLSAFAPPTSTIKLIPSTTDWSSSANGVFDVVITQYVLEHLDDMNRTLRQISNVVSSRGCVIHVVNDLTDRHDWYVAYRMQNSLLRRIQDSLRVNGLVRTLTNPLRFTPPHEPKYGDFSRELGGYRLENWVLKVLTAGFEVIDVFQTRDVNWVLVTRPTVQA